MKYYEIKLTPVETYFFGGEKHNQDLTTDYFVESLDYPQQTTLLGLLRYYLLLKNDLLGGKSLPISKQSEAKNLIGEQSFSYGANHTFGHIKSISPLYFVHDTKGKYLFGPKDIKFEVDNTFQLFYEGQPYNYKCHNNKLNVHVVSQKNSLDYLKTTDIIKDKPQVGNEKKGNENAFYKQTMKKLESGWSFGFDACIDLNLESDVCFLPFGGEKSIFKFEIKAVENRPFYSKKGASKVPSLYLISDAFIDPEEIKKLPFAITDNVSFRNLRSKVSTANYYELKKSKNIEESLVRSSRYNLLKRGSVLYFISQEKKNDFKNKLEQNECFNIGFNHTINR